MQKLIKRRMRSYLHPAGMHVRAYEPEEPPPSFPPGPRPPVSAPADGTSFANPTPQQRLVPGDATHNNAINSIASAALGAAVPASALGPLNAARAAASAAGIAAINTCVNCHLTKKN